MILIELSLFLTKTMNGRANKRNSKFQKMNIKKVIITDIALQEIVHV